MRYKEKKGHWPLMKAKAASTDDEINDSSGDEEVKIADANKRAKVGGVSTRVRSVEPLSPA
jgi:hypothetical protein